MVRLDLTRQDGHSFALYKVSMLCMAAYGSRGFRSAQVLGLGRLPKGSSTSLTSYPLREEAFVSAVRLWQTRFCILIAETVPYFNPRARRTWRGVRDDLLERLERALPV